MSATNTTVEIIKAVKQLGTAAIVGACIVVGAMVYVKNQPTSPGPVPQTDLGSLVEASAHPYLHAFYRDLAFVSKTQAIESTGQFRAVYQKAVQIAQATAELPSVKPIDEPISKRIEIAVGLEDQRLTEATREALVGVLQQVSEEFK